MKQGNLGDVDGFELCKLQPFYRDGTVAAFPGFGLGLPLVKRIINLHKGMIQVNSNVKTGTTFLVKLPAAFAKTDPNHLQNSTH